MFNTNIFDFTGNVFLILVLLAWVWLSTCASRLLHKQWRTQKIFMGWFHSVA